MALAYDLGDDDGRDPAGLDDLRILLHDEMGKRWTRAARNVKRAIVLHDALGIGEKAPMSVMPAADRAAMFGRWLDERLLADIGDGQWVLPYIAETASRAQMVQQQVRNGFGDAQALGSLVSQTSYIEPKSVKVCQAATCGALADIRGAVSRRASEAVRTGLLFPPHSKRAPRIAKAVDAAMGEGLHRSRMLAEHAVTQAYTQATLDVLEARGVTHVGTHGEHCLRDAGLLDGWMADEARHTPQEQHPRSGRYVTKAVHARETHRHIRTGRFTSQKLRAGKQVQAEAEEAQAESRRGPVVIETAGDDRVCDICDGIAANSPYTINQARSLIPAHPNCRCEWVRAEAPARPSLLGPIPEEAERVLELRQPAPATGRGIAAVAAGVLASLAAAAVARPGRAPAPPAPPDPDEVLSEEPPTPPPLPAKPAPPLPEPPQLPAEEPAAEPPESEPPLPPIEFALPAEPMPQALEPGAAPLEPDVAELINRIATRRGVLPGSLTQFYPAGVPPEIGAARRELMWTLNQLGWSIAAIAGWMHVTEHAVAAGIDRHRRLETVDYDPDQPRDEHGRWSAGGGSAASGETAEANAEPPADPMAKAAWILEKARTAVADAGYDPERVHLSSQQQKFKVGDREYSTAGLAFTRADGNVGDEQYRKGDIVIFGQPDYSRDFPVRGTAVHEAMHQKWQAVADRYQLESSRMWDDSAKAASREEEPVYGSGELKPGFEQQYPVYALLSSILEGPFHAATPGEGIGKTNRARMIEDDGVSQYSKSYWDFYKNSGGERYDSAVHETLAEMARIKDAGVTWQMTPVNELTAKPFSPIWNDLHSGVEAAWSVLRGKTSFAEARKSAGKGTARWAKERKGK
jgi:hypothetical protein